VPGENLDLLSPLGQGQYQLEQEAVQLGLRQRVGPLVLHRVLGGDHHEGIGQCAGLTVNRDLALLHGLQQGRLRLGRGTVDLVGQEQVGEDRSGAEGELRAAGVVDERAGDVTWHEVGCELDALGLHVQGGGQRSHQQGLGDSGDPLEQDVPTGEQGDDQSGDCGLLTDDGLAHLAAHGHQSPARVVARVRLGGWLGDATGTRGARCLVGGWRVRITIARADGARVVDGIGAVRAHAE